MLHTYQIPKDGRGGKSIHTTHLHTKISSRCRISIDSKFKAGVADFAKSEIIIQQMIEGGDEYNSFYIEHENILHWYRKLRIVEMGWDGSCWRQRIFRDWVK